MIKNQMHLKPEIFLMVFMLTLVFAITGYGLEKKKTGGKDHDMKKKAQSILLSERVTLQEYPVWMKNYLNSLEWKIHKRKSRLTPKILRKSFNLGRQFLINNQKSAGNFNYQYNFVTKTKDIDDNQVRQAGALWGLALMFQYDQDSRNKAALEKGLKFFFDRTQDGHKKGSLLIAYPGNSVCRTGTVALVALSIIEYLRTEKAGNIELTDLYRNALISKLNGYIAHLKFMRLGNKHFSSGYSLRNRKKFQGFSPYFDGEAMLCLIKAAKYLGYTEMIPIVEDSAMIVAKHYTIDQWRNYPDSKQTKGFYQWSCMAFWEYQDAGWKNAETFGDYVLSLTWWMIHTHHTLQRTRNTAYAYEGIVHAYKLAKTRNQSTALNDLAYTIDKGLFKLTSWQVGGPLQSRNSFLTANPTNDPLAIGGVLNHRNQALLRIDVTQHQMHSVILALRYVYTEHVPSRKSH